MRGRDMSQLFYIQDRRNYVGNSMLWWEENNNGFFCDIRKARIFTEAEARKICRGRGRYARTSRYLKMWPKDYIDKRISHHIDMQDCDFKKTLKIS